MNQIDIWTIYGSREDTDAAVIREMARRVQEAENNYANVNRRNDGYRQAIKDAGLRFVEPYGEHPRLEPIEEKT